MVTVQVGCLSRVRCVIFGRGASPMPATVGIELTAAERHRVQKLARSCKGPYRLVVRGNSVRLAARGAQG